MHIYADQSINQVDGASGQGEVSTHADSGEHLVVWLPHVRIWHPDFTLSSIIQYLVDMDRSVVVRTRGAD